MAVPALLSLGGAAELLSEARSNTGYTSSTPAIHADACTTFQFRKNSVMTLAPARLHTCHAEHLRECPASISKTLSVLRTLEMAARSEAAAMCFPTAKASRPEKSARP